MLTSQFHSPFSLPITLLCLYIHSKSIPFNAVSLVVGFFETFARFLELEVQELVPKGLVLSDKQVFFFSLFFFIFPVDSACKLYVTMAIDVCSEISSAGISPRISFSHDLNQTTDAISIEDHRGRLDSALLDSDFDFCIGNSFAQELSSADELFSNGKILPIEIKKHFISAKHSNDQPKPVASRPHQSNTEITEKKQLKEFLSMSLDADEKPTSKSFWQFKRSNSLNCDSSRSKGLIRSLQFLSRSNSTGSAPNPPKQAMLSKESQPQKPQLLKQPSVSSRKSSVSSSAGAFYPYNSLQKPPPLRKCGSHGNGVRISPVLNIPSPYISRGTVNLFGFGSLFCNGKVKKKKRWWLLFSSIHDWIFSSTDVFSCLSWISMWS